MAFVNEYISEVDAKKYGLDETFKRCENSLRAIYRYKKGVSHWTINNEKEVYFKGIGSVLEPDEFNTNLRSSGVMIFLLYIQGSSYLLYLEYLHRNSSKSYEEVPFCAEWYLSEIEHFNGPVIDKKIVIHNLKDALDTYVFLGVNKNHVSSKVELRLVKPEFAEKFRVFD